LEFDPGPEFFGILIAGPDVPEEIGGRNIAVICEEIPIAPAAEHQVRIEFAAEFGLGLGVDAWKIRHSIEFLAEGGDVIAGEPASAGNAFLDRVKIIPAGAGDKQGGGGAGCAFLGEILNEIEKFTGLAADAGEECEVGSGVIVFEIVIARLISGGAAFEEGEKLIVPGHGVEVSAFLRFCVFFFAHRRDGIDGGEQRGIRHGGMESGE